MSIRRRDFGAIYGALEKNFGLATGSGDTWRVESIAAGADANGLNNYYIIVYVVGAGSPFQVVKIVISNQGVATLTVPASSTSSAHGAVITSGTVVTAGALSILNNLFKTDALSTSAEGAAHI